MDEKKLNLGSKNINQMNNQISNLENQIAVEHKRNQINEKVKCKLENKYEKIQADRQSDLQQIEYLTKLAEELERQMKGYQSKIYESEVVAGEKEREMRRTIQAIRDQEEREEENSRRSSSKK